MIACTEEDVFGPAPELPPKVCATCGAADPDESERGWMIGLDTGRLYCPPCWATRP